MSNKLNEELSRIRSVMGLNEMSAGFGHGFHAGDSPGGGFKSEESMSPSISWSQRPGRSKPPRRSWVKPGEKE